MQACDKSNAKKGPGVPARLDSVGWGGAWWPGRGRREASPWGRSWPGWPGLKEGGEEEEEQQQQQEPLEQYIRVLWLRPARAYWREKGGGGTGAGRGQGSRAGARPAAWLAASNATGQQEEEQGRAGASTGAIPGARTFVRCAPRCAHGCCRCYV